MSRGRPPIEQVRLVGQPASVTGRFSGEQWAGRLYMRRASPYVTQRLATTRITPDGVTWAMMGCGLLAAAVLTLPGVPASVCAVLLVQGQLLLDCVDGELARVRGRTGPMGVYLDRVGHFSTEAALAAAIGLRADGGWQSIGGWTTVGLSVAVLVLLIKAETELVHVARHHAGLPVLPDSAERIMPAGLLSLRRIADLVPIHRALLALEVSVLALLAALVDAAATSLVGTRTLLLVLLGVAVLVVTGHLVTIVTSRKLR